MRRFRDFGFAILAWLIPFVVSVALYPLKRVHPPFFESLMAITLAGSTVVLALAYLRRERGNPFRASLKIAVIWTAANWLLDSLMFSGGPMRMSFAAYAMDIGAAYLMIPLITIGIGLAATSSAHEVTASD